MQPARTTLNPLGSTSAMARTFAVGHSSTFSIGHHLASEHRGGEILFFRLAMSDPAFVLFLSILASVAFVVLFCFALSCLLPAFWISPRYDFDWFMSRRFQRNLPGGRYSTTPSILRHARRLAAMRWFERYDFCSLSWEAGPSVFWGRLLVRVAFDPFPGLEATSRLARFDAVCSAGKRFSRAGRSGPSVARTPSQVNCLSRHPVMRGNRLNTTHTTEIHFSRTGSRSGIYDVGHLREDGRQATAQKQRVTSPWRRERRGLPASVVGQGGEASEDS